MSYDYKEMQKVLFTDAGQRTFLSVRDHTRHLLKQAGACRSQEMMATGRGGDSWLLLACIDRLVELKELTELTEPGVFGQSRVFIDARG